MSYLHYSEDDFFHDPKFRKWVLQPDPELNYFWEKWLINHPEKEAQIKVARRLVKAIQIEEYEWESQRKNNLWQKINYSIKHKSVKKPQSNVIQLNHPHYEDSRRSFFKSTWIKAAAISSFLIASIYYIGQQYDKHSLSEQPVSNTVEKYNPKGQKSKVFLPDGSVVYLNSTSKLVYPQEFDSEQRLVQLEGEAFFDVVRDTLKPFIVKAGDLKTTVLGTSFNINAFSAEETTQISLIEGQLKVASLNDSNSVILTSGQSATLHKLNKKIHTGTVDYLSDIAWKDGILYFNNTSLSRAFEILEKWYGVEFHFNQTPDSHTLITGKFENEYLTNVLKSLSYSVSFDYTIENGNELYINFK